MQIRSFITHKRGACVNSIQDCIAMDEKKGRFALSDGVSDSVLPEIWADILTHAYLSVDNIQQFPPEGLQQLFLSQKESYLSTLDKEQRFIQKLIEKHLKTGAATFVGIELRENELSWQVIGDSCLFILPDGEPLQCVSSNPSHMDEDGHLHIEFDNFPRQIHSDGTLHGEWIKGNRPFHTGCILMMSDAMSAWFVKQFNQGNSPLDQLKAIRDNDEFEAFVEDKCQQKELESDDESIIFITIGDQSQEGTEGTANITKTEITDEAGVVASTDVLNVAEVTDDVKKTESTEGISLNESPEKVEKDEQMDEAQMSHATVDSQSPHNDWKRKLTMFAKSILSKK